MDKRTRPNIIISNWNGWLEVDISTDAHPDSVMKIDKSDWRSLKSMGVGRVSAVDKNTKIYAQAQLNGKKVIIHKLLLPDSNVVDHRNGDGIDNRRSNIRACTHAQNNMNSRVRSHSKTGIKGVSYETRSGNWYARIRANGICKHLGTFSNAEDASQAYQRAAKELHGEFMYTDKKGEV